MEEEGRRVEFFQSCPPPADLPDVGEKVRKFVQHHTSGSQKPVALVTVSDDKHFISSRRLFLCWVFI